MKMNEPTKAVLSIFMLLIGFFVFVCIGTVGWALVEKLTKYLQ